MCWRRATLRGGHWVETVDPVALGILAGAVTVGLGQAQVAESWGPGSGVGGAAFGAGAGAERGGGVSGQGLHS